MECTGFFATCLFLNGVVGLRGAQRQPTAINRFSQKIAWLVGVMFACHSIAFAHTPLPALPPETLAEENPLYYDENRKHRVTLIDESDSPHPIKRPKSLQSALVQHEKMGYISRHSHIAQQLLHLQDMRLHRSLRHIRLQLPYRPLSFVSDKERIGFAQAVELIPYNGLPNTTPSSGVIEYFNYPAIGTCKYLRHVPRIERVSIDKQQLLYVNRSPAQAINEGTTGSGFAYMISWYERALFHELTCVSAIFSAKITQKTHELAQLIDREDR